MSSALHINNNDVGRGSEYFMIESFVNPTKEDASSRPCSTATLRLQQLTYQTQ
jgi:hypothetical protein